MRAPSPGRRVVVDVDSRGRVSLARFGLKNTQMIVNELDDGGMILHPAIVMTPAEARHYADPDAVNALDEAIRSAQAGELERLKLRSQTQ
jgi:hypothetical protein